MTSGKALKLMGVADPSRTRGHEIQSQLSRPGFENIAVNVMAGRRGPIHDRFLIVDDIIWHSGNSLESLGQRFSLMIKLPDGEPVLKRIQTLIDEKSRPLAEWAANYDRARADD